MSQELTPEQVARIAASRRQAQERLQQRAGGQPPAADAERPKPRLRGSKLSKGYYEYNLSTMRDTHAGFLEEDAAAAAAAAGSPEKRRRVVVSDERLPDLDDGQACCECSSADVDVVYLKVFKTAVCKACIEKIPDRYSLLTKTEAKDDYLLTDSELRDRALFPVWEKPNPHKSTWNNMLLYLRRDLEAFAVKKWGSLEALDGEFERRVEEKRARKEKKYQRSVADLRRRTRAEEWEKARRERLKLESEHEHAFEDSGNDGEQRCSACGLVIEVEEFGL
ncbi:DNA repair protein rad14 [Coemansia nantahalensis]|uniref:DNA repair protein rad14 n=1 Tax=Coemansia nantahalensis TaxID=2789366 RepID=A0ACC1JYX6_9FUNG|nr:DNA repair protein rad14 [Coemansia nantahalensis]